MINYHSFKNPYPSKEWCVSDEALKWCKDNQNAIGVKSHGHVWISTKAVAALSNWRHDNILRALRSMLRHDKQLDDLTYSVDEAHKHFFHAKYNGGEVGHVGAVGSASAGVMVLAPIWLDFVTWLLKTTTRKADRESRMSSLCGDGSSERLRELTVLSGLSERCPLRLLDALNACYIVEDIVPDARITTLPTISTENGRVRLGDLSTRLGYSVRRLAKVHFEYAETLPEDAEDRAVLIEDSSITFRAAMYLLMKLPRATNERLRIFNELLERVQPARVPLEDGGPNFNVPALAEAAYKDLAEKYDKELLEHAEAKKLALSYRSHLRVTEAEVAGKTVENAKLKEGLALSASAGNLAANNIDDHIVRNAAELRRTHNLMGKKDLYQELYKRRICDASLVAESQRDIFTIMTWWVCEKLLSADGAPVVRACIIESDYARRYRVYASGAGQEGAALKHGEASKTVWQLFFTPAGVTNFIKIYDDLRLEWIRSGRPKSCLDRTTKTEAAAA